MNTEIVGQPRNRVDGFLKVTGQAKYTAEIAIPDTTHMVIVQSTITSGRITHIQTQEAENAPGVLGVITHLNAQRLASAPVSLDAAGRQSTTGSAGQSFMPLQDDRIFYNGQHIALVIAETLEQAQYAASLVMVRYERDEPVITMDVALPQAIKPKNVWGAPPDTSQGDMEQGLAEAEVRIEQTYITAMQNHTTMETHATIACWDGDALTVYEPSTWVYGVRKAVAHWFQMPEEKIHVIQHFVGGSFGCKGPTWPHVALTALAAKHVGRPVKLMLTRQQEFMSAGYRPEIHQTIQLGATRDGRLTAIAHHAFAQTAHFDMRVVAPVTKSTRKLYACPNIVTTYCLLHMNLSGPFTMRGPGESPGLFAIECAMDELAYALAMDPLELRLRNYAEQDPESGFPWSSKSLRQCYQQGAERFGWQKRTPQPRSMSDGDYLVGWGMATMAYDAKSAPAAARVHIQADGHIVVQSATCDQGTGSYTVMSQLAADALHVPLDMVRFELGDTDMPQAPIAAGSQTTASVGSAVQAVCLSLRDKLLTLACTDTTSPLHECTEQQIEVENGTCFCKENPAKHMTYADIVALHPQEKLEATEQVKPDEDAKNYSCYSFGAHFAEVYVHRVSGETRVNRYVGAFGAGRIINTKTAHSQLLGGIIWGIGMALQEHVIIDTATGRIINADLAEYHVPVHADIPPIDAFFVEEHDPHVNTIGVKGIGEIGTIGAAAAIANAVYHATGTRIRDLPITLDKLLTNEHEHTHNADASM